MSSQQQNVVPPTQPDNAYQPQPTNPHPQEQYLPPSYEQAKDASRAQPPPAAVIPLNMLSDQPQYIDCPFCHQRAITTVKREGTSMQIVVGAIFCLVCVCLTCIPCLAGWFEDTEYHCSNCKSLVALRHHDGPIEVFAPQVPVQSQYSQQPPMQPPSQQPQYQPQYQPQHELHEIQPVQQPAGQPPVKN